MYDPALPKVPVVKPTGKSGIYRGLRVKQEINL